MKKALTIFALLISGVAMGQETVTTEFKYEYVTPDTTGKICKERGHVSPGVGTSTSAWCPPYQIDYADSTVMVYPVCNTTSYVCQRCGETISEHGKESRVVTWRRPLKEETAVSVQEVIDTTSLTLFNDESIWVPGEKINGTEAIIYKELSIDFYNPSGKIIQSITWRDKVLTFQMLLDYEKECTKDTLRIIKLVGEYASFFVVNGDLVGAVRYEKELSDKGYHYIYNHYEFYDPASKSSKCYYYYVKEATLKGFIQWYKGRGK